MGYFEQDGSNIKAQPVELHMHARALAATKIGGSYRAKETIGKLVPHSLRLKTTEI